MTSRSIYLREYSPPGKHWIGGSVCPRAGLEIMEKRRILTLPGIKPPTIQPVAIAIELSRIIFMVLNFWICCFLIFYSTFYSLLFTSLGMKLNFAWKNLILSLERSGDCLIFGLLENICSRRNISQIFTWLYRNILQVKTTGNNYSTETPLN
jgi:hypothetical protein